MARQTPTGYSRVQIRLHWIVAVLVALQFLLHDGVEDAYERARDTGQYILSLPAIAHFASGMIIFLLVVWRILIKKDRGTPAAPAGEPEIFARLSTLAHLAMYVLLLAMPFSGVMAWGGQMQIAGWGHELASKLLFALVVLHIGAALVHQFVWRTGLLTRMMRPED